MFSTLRDILSDNWTWRRQIGSLSVFELIKRCRGSIFSWVWLFARPAMYIFCFWFALDLGLRAGESTGDLPPYFLWLCAGLIPWFFIQDMLAGGVDVLHRFAYLATKVKFPLSAISTVFTSASFVIQLGLIAALMVIYFLMGQPFDLYLLQVPLLLILMFFFWDMVSILFSQLSAISKDFCNLVHALSTPLFWLSGVIFNIEKVPVPWLSSVLAFNPISFFVEGFRSALYYKRWLWDTPEILGGFVVVVFLTLIVMLWVYKRSNKTVVDEI